MKNSLAYVVDGRQVRTSFSGPLKGTVNIPYEPPRLSRDHFSRLCMDGRPEQRLALLGTSRARPASRRTLKFRRRQGHFVDFARRRAESCKDLA